MTQGTENRCSYKKAKALCTWKLSDTGHPTVALPFVAAARVFLQKPTLYACPETPGTSKKTRKKTDWVKQLCISQYQPHLTWQPLVPGYQGSQIMFPLPNKSLIISVIRCYFLHVVTARFSHPRFGTHISGASPVFRRMQLTNPTPFGKDDFCTATNNTCTALLLIMKIEEPINILIHCWFTN